MGDISRHRNIFYNTQDVIPPALLAGAKLSAGDMTYLELGNYLTDVSQFRDPVMYIFSKQRIWRDFIIPKTGDKAETARIISALTGAAALAAGEVVNALTSGVGADIAKYTGRSLGALGGLLAITPNDLLADIFGADEWIDQMFGTPLEKTMGDLKKRDDKHYGFVGQYFRYFIEGMTHLIFAENITNKISGDWSKIQRIPDRNLTEVYTEFFTQYYPHEHTDQPPYVWDASQRPKVPNLYGPSSRQRTLTDPDIGIMNAVDSHYVQYLSERLSDVEHEWTQLKPADIDGRRKLLVQLGKILHGIEDWYFHSNVVEILRIHFFSPLAGVKSKEDLLEQFVNDISSKDPEFITVSSQKEKLRLQRRLFRRLRFPEYDRGDKINSGGIISKRPSTLSLHHVYPAFPSQQDTTHTLLHALENLERKITPHGSTAHPPTSLPEWAPCVFSKLLAAQGGAGQQLLKEKANARGVNVISLLAALPTLTSPGNNQQKATMTAVIIDVMREWLPLVVTLLIERERQRLVANVDPLQWPVMGNATVQPEKGKKADFEAEEQLKRHKKALEPRPVAGGGTENNYETAARFLQDCGFINAAGRQALATAFAIDQKSSTLMEDAPGCGGFLIKFSLELQTKLDEGDAATEKLNNKDNSKFDKASDNGAFNEIIGSHSLMSKDTLESPPFFDDARVLASVASSSVFHIFLEKVGTPSVGKRMPWKPILHHFIRYPSHRDGWERHALNYFRNNNQKIPKFTDLPELPALVQAVLGSKEALTPFEKGKKDEELKNRYIRLEAQLSRYRYP